MYVMASISEVRFVVSRALYYYWEPWHHVGVAVTGRYRLTVSTCNGH